MADNNNDNPEPKDEKVTPAPNLEQVHESAKNIVEDEDSNKGEDEKPKDDDDEKDEHEKDKEEPESPEEDSPDENEDEEPAEPDKPDKPEVDDDTTKNAPGKIAVKDYSGKTFYFNNLEEVPDDFEPASYKEWGRAVNEFAQKDAKETAEAEAEAKKAQKDAQDKEAAKLQKGWDKDIAALKKSGDLPKDEKASGKVVDEVFEYMETQLKEGVVIDSFNQAYKALMYDKQKEQDAKEADELKKRRGGMVLSGGSSSGAAAPRNGVRQGVPQGVSLDAVHEKALSEL